MLRELVRRWLVFVAALGLTLVPGVVSLLLLPWVAEMPRLLDLAWVWSIMAIPAAGFSRIDSPGVIYLADWAWLAALGFWAAAGLVFSLALLRVGLRTCMIAAMPVIVAIGSFFHLALSWAGITAFTYL
jgi:hypothetical protein